MKYTVLFLLIILLYCVEKKQVSTYKSTIHTDSTSSKELLPKTKLSSFHFDSTLRYQDTLNVYEEMIGCGCCFSKSKSNNDSLIYIFNHIHAYVVVNNSLCRLTYNKNLFQKNAIVVENEKYLVKIHIHKRKYVDYEYTEMEGQLELIDKKTKKILNSIFVKGGCGC